MWLIFLGACIVVALAALLVIWIGSKIFRSIEKQDRQSELEEEVNRQNKEKLRKRMEDKTV